MLFDKFDNIRIINLAHRRDRRRQMLGELRKVGLDKSPRVRFFKAFSFPDPGPFSSRGAHGCFYSHHAVLREAADSGKSLLILEDDCDFLPNISAYRMPSDWDIFYGGYEAADPDDLQNSDIIGGHFIGFNADTARRVADYLDEMLKPGFCSCDIPPVDGAYVWFRRAYPDVRTVFAMPQLGAQRPSRTDIADLKFFDRLPVLRQVSSLARRAKRRFA